MEIEGKAAFRQEVESCLVLIADKKLAVRAALGQDDYELFYAIEMLGIQGVSQSKFAWIVEHGGLSDAEGKVLSELSDIFIALYRKYGQADDMSVWVPDPAYAPVYDLAKHALSLMGENDRQEAQSKAP